MPSTIEDLRKEECSQNLGDFGNQMNVFRIKLHIYIIYIVFKDDAHVCDPAI